MIATYGVDVCLATGEDVLKIVDDIFDQHRGKLAEAVAASRGCEALANRDSIAIRGDLTAVAAATALYKSLVTSIEKR